MGAGTRTTEVDPVVAEKYMDAHNAAGGNKFKRTPLAKQSLGLLATALAVALCAWAFVQDSMAAEVDKMNLKTGVFILVVSYVYADYWLWMLHCFLDRIENLESRFPTIKHLAVIFQQHHDLATTLLRENHLGELDDIVAATAGTGLALGYWTSPSTKLIMCMVCVWGSLAGLNHFYGHARTARYEIPPLFKYGQDWGLLPTARHHKIHHTAPFEMNWNFLNGFYQIYETTYFATGSSYNALMCMFYTTNPVGFQVLALALGILA